MHHFNFGPEGFWFAQSLLVQPSACRSIPGARELWKKVHFHGPVRTDLPGDRVSLSTHHVLPFLSPIQTLLFSLY